VLAPGAPLNCDYFEQQLYRPQLRFAARDFDLLRIATAARCGIFSVPAENPTGEPNFAGLERSGELLLTSL